MKKDIYIIRNTINDKVYIGQATDTAERWKKHIYDARYENKNNIEKQVIHKAMIKYGYENFYYEILESQIDNYNEREQYWIKKYNSLIPNGYNVSPGGDGVGGGFESPNSLIKDKETLLKIISEISSSNKTFANIARKYKIGEEVISAINQGYRYKQDNFEYPLRQTRYTQELLKQIRYSLKYELDYSFRKIAEIYNVDYSQISLINQGKIYYIATEDYPLRKKRRQDLDDDVVNMIIDDIINSDLCMSDIAKKYNVSKMRISGINNGKFYANNKYKYPLREEYDPRNKGCKKYISRETIIQIHEYLKQGLSNNKIANLVGVSPTMIGYINAGKVKKYVIEGINYPIKQIRKH